MYIYIIYFYIYIAKYANIDDAVEQVTRKALASKLVTFSAETDAIMLNPVGNWSTSEIQYLYIFNPTLHYPPPIICAFYMQNRCFSTP